MESPRARVTMASLVLVAILGTSLGALALGRSSARAVRPAITYSDEIVAAWRVVDPAGVNGREEPAGDVARRLGTGEVLHATGRLATVQGETWREVRTRDGDVVWVLAALVSRVADPTDPPPTIPPTVPPTTPPSTTPPTTVPPAPVFGDEKPGAWQVTGIDQDAHLNVRTGPGTSNAVVARLAHDAANIASTGRIAGFEGSLWREVEYRSGRTGWVNASFLEKYVPVPVFGSEKPGEWDVTGVKAGEFLNVRSGPGTANEIVARLEHDISQVASTGKTATIDGALWREVRWSDAGSRGWVNARFLAAHKPATPPPAPSSPGIIVMGDWDGNGVRTPGVFRDGVWHLRLSNSAGPADLVFAFGEAGDKPVVGDWNGDGIETPGVVRGSTWHLRNANSAGAADATFTFGNAGDTPVAGDWNGDGIDTPGVVRGSSWHLRNTNSAGNADIVFTYGDPGDKPVVGDWNGDGIDTAGVVRGARWLLRDANSAGGADRDFSFGDAGDRPVAGDWNGDRVDAPGVVRGSTVHLRNQSTAGGADASFSYTPAG